jgi:outer membrane receptor protein involved in Fe transport
VALDPATNRYVAEVTNAGNGSTWGLELDVRWEFNWGRLGQFIPKGNYSYLGSRLFDTRQQTYRKFKGQPDYVYNVGFEYITRNSRFSVGANYNEVPINVEAEAKTDGTYEEKESTNITRLDVFASYTLTRRLSTRLAAQNLLTQTKSVQKRAYLANNTLTKYDVENEVFQPTFMVSVQWNLR